MTYNLLQKFGTEACSSFLAILFGLSVVANDHLLKTKGGNSVGFGFIAFGFGMSFAIPIIVFGFVSAHLNPAMCIALLVLGKIDAEEAFVAIGGEMVGMFLGAVAMYLLYFPHFNLPPEIDAESNDDRLVKEDQKRKLSVYATGPAVKIHWTHSFYVPQFSLRRHWEFLLAMFKSWIPRVSRCIVRSKESASAGWSLSWSSEWEESHRLLPILLAISALASHIMFYLLPTRVLLIGHMRGSQPLPHTLAESPELIRTN